MASSDMRYLVQMNNGQDIHAFCVTRLAELFNRSWVDIQTSSLVYEVDNREASLEGVGCVGC